MEKRLTLNREHVVYLTHQPEQGMGYHIVEASLKNGKVLKNRIVLNSSYLILNEEEQIQPNEIATIEVKSDSSFPTRRPGVM